MKKIWVVEIRCDGWHPTVGVGLTRTDARKELRDWKKCNPDDQFRLRPYFPKEEQEGK